MQKHTYTDALVDDLILKFADESFTLREAVTFESLLKENSQIYELATANREIRKKLKNLPKVKAAPGFEARLMARINYG